MGFRINNQVLYLILLHLSLVRRMMKIMSRYLCSLSLQSLLSATSCRCHFGASVYWIWGYLCYVKYVTYFFPFHGWGRVFCMCWWRELVILIRGFASSALLRRRAFSLLLPTTNHREVGDGTHSTWKLRKTKSFSPLSLLSLHTTPPANPYHQPPHVFFPLFSVSVLRQWTKCRRLGVFRKRWTTIIIVIQTKN